ncbi:MAG: hypothetical protein KIS78_33495 [Labilithrix sp.]|nr:hypothetical protein [Labilithrix sp.]MCW5837358.1 hypothetical protein [Labilithrix sp.]
MKRSGRVASSRWGGSTSRPTSRAGAKASLALAAVLALTGAGGVARADESTADSAAEARQQYGMGTQAFSQKRYSEAALHFEAAASFKASAIALYTAALAWDLASRPERAADAYGRALEVPGLDAKQTGIAKDRVAALEKSLGTVVVTAPEGWKVQLDTLTEVPAPARLHASPGVHTLTVRIPNKPIERRDVTLEAGKVTNLELKDEPAPAPAVDPEPVAEAPAPASEAPPPRLREPFWTTMRVIGVGVAGVGVAALGAGAILGTSANGAKEAYDAAPSRAAFDHASSLETWTNVALISGAVLVAGGIALVVVPLGERSDGAVRVGAAPGSVVVGGTF